MTLKAQHFQQKKKKKKKNQTFFVNKFLENILTFKNFQPKFLDFGQRMADFTRFWKNFGEKKSAKMGKFGLVLPVKQGFCVCVCVF